jgi:putative acetyltransferase
MTAIIRKVSRSDNSSVSAIIRSVMPEFGAGGPGFAIHDPEVEDIYSAYNIGRAAYFVCEEDGKIVGGGGVAPLLGGTPEICELKKMYFLPFARGRGLGQNLLTRCLDAAHEFGFEKCYIETFNTMHNAMKLYEKNGFKKIPGPLGQTGHFACDIFYVRELQ